MDIPRCDINQRVNNRECVDCDDETINFSGDIPIGEGDTSCIIKPICSDIFSGDMYQTVVEVLDLTDKTHDEIYSLILLLTDSQGSVNVIFFPDDKYSEYIKPQYLFFILLAEYIKAIPPGDLSSVFNPNKNELISKIFSLEIERQDATERANFINGINNIDTINTYIMENVCSLYNLERNGSEQNIELEINVAELLHIPLQREKHLLMKVLLIVIVYLLVIHLLILH